MTTSICIVDDLSRASVSKTAFSSFSPSSSSVSWTMAELRDAPRVRPLVRLERRLETRREDVALRDVVRDELRVLAGDRARGGFGGEVAFRGEAALETAFAGEVALEGGGISPDGGGL